MIRLLGYLGEACRLAGRLDAADAALTEALIASISSGKARSITAGLIRLGELRRCEDRFAEAEKLLREALLLADERGHPDCAVYRDFALQHLDVGRPDEAMALFEQALTIRRAAGATSLTASTEEALRLARSRRAGTAPEG